MGCVHSKQGTRKGLHTQQEEFVGNNNKVSPGRSHDPAQARSSPLPLLSPNDQQSTSRSHHSPPTSCRSSQNLPSLEGLGSLSEVWSLPQQWDKFKQYLATINEGEDSDGQPLSMMRYATFLELYARLDMEYKRGTGREKLVQLVKQIADHTDGFLDRERCLKCVDGGMRREVLERIKNVRNGSEEAGPRVFILIYPRVVDRLGEMLGNYQNMVMRQN